MIYLKDVTTLRFQEEKCTGCGMCLAVCPHEVLIPNNGKVRVQNRDACMECGACSRNCPTGAITVQSGVGCAAAVINTALGRKKDSCCCVIEGKDSSTGAEKEDVTCC
jgi:NAD-dependent dihydropyrimidine dehydrogenase PreA subunit